MIFFAGSVLHTNSEKVNTFDTNDKDWRELAYQLILSNKSSGIKWKLRVDGALIATPARHQMRG